MRFSESRRALFVHVQKTGGSTVQRILDEHLPDSTKMLPKHAGLSSALRRRPELAAYWAFGFVRNPWARMVSWWSMVQGLHERDPGHKFFQNQEMWRTVAACPDFETFVLEAPRSYAKLRRPQISYLTAPGGRRADFIGRTETFEEDLRAVLVRLGLPDVEIPHANRSEHSHYRDYYSDAARERVGTLFRADVEAFGYDF